MFVRGILQTELLLSTSNTRNEVRQPTPAKGDIRSMRDKTMLGLALVAGFVGGMASQYLFSTTVHAQTTDIPQQIWAHEFVLADQSGTALEAIGVEKDGRPSMEFLRPNGKVQAIRFNDGLNSIYVGAGPRQKTLLPIKP